MSISLHRACNRGYGSTTFRSRLGLMPEPRVDLNAFLIVCFMWRRPRQPRVQPIAQPGRWPR